jgi:hypothetical protein
MARRRRLLGWLPVLCLAPVPVLRAQLNPPHLAYVYPAGGQRGTTFQVTLGGQFLNSATQVYVSGAGVHAAVIESARPMTPMQVMKLRDRLQELQKQRNDPAAQKEIIEIRKKLATFTRNVNPVLAETVTVQVTAAPDAEPGRREIRLATPQGLSNPLAFIIGTLPEFSEKQSEIRILVPGINQQEVMAAEADMSVTLPVTINGRIVPRAARPQPSGPAGQPFTPGDTDRCRFEAHKGLRLVCAVSARELMPYLADAVPGWFQPALRLVDDKGDELAYADHYRFHPDPVLECTIPRDGEYLLEIRDALYRGREDFVYRITLAAGAEPAPARVPAVAPALPETREKEPNNSPKAAQRIKLPVIVNGRVDPPGDWDVFAFNGRAGDQIVAEVYARRLDSPLDSLLRLTDAGGRQVAFNDDHEDKGWGLLTHHADSLIAARLPAAGTYYLYLGDIQHHGGPEYTYRLRVSPPRPDFELRVTPSAVNAAGGMTVPITVYALRKDGFAGEIALALKAAPRGLILSGGLIPAGQDQVRATLSVSPPAALFREPVSLTLEGRAVIQGREVVRQAAPADEMMQAFAYHHLVPAADLKLAVARRNVFRTPPRITARPPVKIPAGGSVRIQVEAELPPNSVISNLSYELSDPPEGVTLRQDGGLVLACDAAKGKPGLKGNLIIQILGERQAAPGNRPAAPNLRRVALGALPALPFEIVP